MAMQCTKGDQSSQADYSFDLLLFPLKHPNAVITSCYPHWLLTRTNACMQIMLRGRNVMMGYLADETKTAQVIDENGWLHTGDIGQLDKVVCA